MITSLIFYFFDTFFYYYEVLLDYIPRRSRKGLIKSTIIPRAMEFEYSYQNNKYKMLVPSTKIIKFRKPYSDDVFKNKQSKILSVCIGDTDVTEEFLPYTGPKGNLYSDLSIRLTLRDFNHVFNINPKSVLIIMDDDANLHEFKVNQIIKLAN